ncbi:outer membrane beta-barrel protein [Aureicoccus marinus]|uniref:TonB-dependent receptor n=1 Tax=Aureicoccus marinus TaxID=754435 RepID=A0A2S7TAK8_9FLAO|nr:outer membrane beta-barrel protein [Aureicoccus marinus]PQJ16674.1 TonB-dependent receptor [Aureicoccus marinus]
MRKTLLALLLVLPLGLLAQSFEVTGKVLTAEGKKPLDAATVYIESLKDSSLVTYAITNASGEFILEGETRLKKFRLLVSYTGYKGQQRLLDFKRSQRVPDIFLEEQAVSLREVSVTGDRVPIRIKQDTLEFNADSFKTRPDATVEDVLKQLPGVEIDSEGTITVNGKEVNQVLVNGQVFFSTDPKVATKSLPKEIISKIQITNTKTREQEFSGDEGDGETKTINLTIKEDKNKGYLGRLSGGYGTDERYQSNGLLNYFNDKTRVSVLGSSNNINNSGFSFDEVFDLVGGFGGGNLNVGNGGTVVFGFGQGITTSSTLGGSFADEKKDQYEISSNYFWSNSENINEERTSRENILPDRRFFTDSESDFEGSTESHRASAELEFELADGFEISLEPTLVLSSSESLSASNTTSSDELGELINRNTTNTRSTALQRRFDNEIELLKRTDTLGSYLRLSFNGGFNESGAEDFQESLQETFGDDPLEERFDQLRDQDNLTTNLGWEFRYRRALSKGVFVDAGYEFGNNTQDNRLSVFERDELTDEFTAFNERLSTDFEFSNRFHQPNISFRKRGEKLRFNATVNYRMTDLENQDALQGASFTKSYKNFLFNARASYRFSRNARMSFNYNSGFQAPSANQLQPIENLSNPLNIVVGNPDLNPVITHRVSFNVSNYNWREQTGFFLYSGVTAQNDQITSVTLTDENLLRTTTFTNIDGNSTAYLGGRYSKQIKKDSTFTLGFALSPRLNRVRRVGFTNGERLISSNLNFRHTASLNFNFKEKLTIEPEYTFITNRTRFNLEGFDDIDFDVHQVILKTTTYWPKNVIWGNDINYQYNGNVGEGFDPDAIFWNMSLGYQFMQKKMTAKVLAYDLLNQNINTRRTSGADFIQDFQGTVLRRYFMFSFSYKFDQFGGKAPNGGGRRWFRA